MCDNTIDDHWYIIISGSRMIVNYFKEVGRSIEKYIDMYFCDHYHIHISQIQNKI